MKSTRITNRNVASAATGQLARKAASGAVALMIRQGLVYGSNIAGGIILARLLTPQDFGFYGIVLFFVAFLNIFGGTGFAANLIRAEEHPTIADLRAVFTGQQIMVATIFLAVWVTAPWVASHYHLQHHGPEFFRLIGVSLVLTSMMVISQVLMERELAFGKLAIVEVLQSLVFNVFAVLLAWRGVGVLSFAIALACRAGCGAILSNIIEPWAVGWLWAPRTLKRHLLFGVSLQSSQFISLAKDSITPLFVGLYLGTTQMGYVTWASTLAGYPAMLLMPLQRLYMPFFARLQSDRLGLQRYAAHAMWITNAIAAPLVVTTCALAHPITILIFGSKWLPALALFFCLAFSTAAAVGSAPMLGLLNALGKSNVTLSLAVTWMIATWALGVPLMLKLGMIGFGIAIVGVQITNLGLYWAVWREASVSILPSLWPSWPVAFLVGGLTFLLQRWMTIRSVPELAVVGIAALLIYAAVLWFGFPQRSRTLKRVFYANAG